MGNVQSYVVASLSVCSVYLAYVHIYRSYKLLQSKVLHSEKLPSFLYLYTRYLTRALTWRRGHLHATLETCECVYTALECRLHTPVLRRFCRAAGYGWDYPDTGFRDLPLCFPQFLCGRLLLIALTSENFRLSPAGLVPVRQSLKTLEPVDELKKGQFMLQVRVLEYRRVEAGVEVDICLSATSRTGRPVWESVLTLLSKNKCHKDSRFFSNNENESDQQSGKSDEPVPENVKQVELRVPWSTNLQCVWSSSDYSPCWPLSLLARLFGYRSHTTPSLWMLSVCLAEIEKHKGVDVITAPINVSAQFKDPLLAPGKVTIRIWELAENGETTEVHVYHDYQQVAFKMYPGNGHVTENSCHSGNASLDYKMPEVISNSQDDQHGMNKESFRGNSMWTLDSSSQACSGLEDNSTDPHETLTESSTLTFVDAQTIEESAENHSIHGVRMVYLKEFVLIDDDDDGDMSLREKTVTDLSNTDGKAAELVCGRLLSTSSGTVSESKEESPGPEASAEQVGTAPKRKHCCFCTLL